MENILGNTLVAKEERESILVRKFVCYIYFTQTSHIDFDYAP